MTNSLHHTQPVKAPHGSLAGFCVPKELPIIFSTAMVQAILDGKTQTRRAINPQPDSHHWEGMPGHQLHAHLLETPKTTAAMFYHSIPQNVDESMWRRCPYGRLGDLLYVRESFYQTAWYYWFKTDADDQGLLYLPDNSEVKPKWKPSIHMPKKHARIWLKVENVRVERVQDISEEDAIKEGVEYGVGLKHVAFFEELWDSINSKRGFGWNENPWVWVIDFSVVSTTGRPEATP